jgi:hypothetical protein
MHSDRLSHWQHDHSFGQDARKPGESRPLIAIAVAARKYTAVQMHNLRLMRPVDRERARCSAI